MPFLILKFLIPPNGSLPLMDALNQATGLDRFRARLTAFAPGRAERMQLARPDGIL